MTQPKMWALKKDGCKVYIFRGGKRLIGAGGKYIYGPVVGVAKPEEVATSLKKKAQTPEQKVMVSIPAHFFLYLF